MDHTSFHRISSCRSPQSQGSPSCVVQSPWERTNGVENKGWTQGVECKSIWKEPLVTAMFIKSFKDQETSVFHGIRFGPKIYFKIILSHLEGWLNFSELRCLIFSQWIGICSLPPASNISGPDFFQGFPGKNTFLGVFGLKESYHRPKAPLFKMKKNGWNTLHFEHKMSFKDLILWKKFAIILIWNPLKKIWCVDLLCTGTSNHQTELWAW